MSKVAISEMVAGLGPVVSGAALYAIEPDNFKSSVDSADTPSRILLPSTEGDAHAGEPKGIGAQSRMVWVVKDLYLFMPAGDAMGWASVGYALDAYCDSYASVLTAENHSKTGFCSINAEVLGWDMLPGVFTYPTGSTNQYYGVLVTLRVQEGIQA